jgi:hypothetical protein
MGLILKGLSHEMDLAFDDMYGYWLILGLNRGRPVLKFFSCSNDFKTQKVYFLRLLKVYIILIMSAACIYSRFSCQQGLGHFLRYRYRPLLPIGWRTVQIVHQRWKKITNTAPTTHSAVQAASQSTANVNWH